MCSIGEDDFGDEGGLHTMKEEILEDSKILADEICKKCNKEKAVVKLAFKEAQCKECFFLYVRHKFRASLGATKIVPRNSNVLVIFDGKPENIVLLDMLNYALTEAAFKRLQFKVTVLYIDESCLENISMDERMSNLSSKRMILNQFNLETYYTSIGNTDSYCEIHKINNINNFDHHLSAAEESFNKLLSSIKTLTSRQEYLRLSKQNIFRRVAKELKCNFIFLSEIISDLAKTLLTNIALGRGSSVAFDVSFFDDRVADIKSIRPIKDLNQNEVMSYIRLKELKYLAKESFGQKSGEYASIQNLTSKFLDGLQINFPSTIPTIFRTGDKICTNGKSQNFEKNEENQLETDFTQQCTIFNKCNFCKVDLDYQGSDTLYAIEYSRLVSANNSSILNREDVLNAVKGLDNDVNKTKVKTNLCHACRNILVDLNEKYDNAFL